MGIGTAETAVGLKLNIIGQILIAGGSPGYGKVLTSDASGLASWKTLSWDNLGNHTANGSMPVH